MVKKTVTDPSGKVQLEVLNPRGVVEAKPTFAPAPSFTDLAGKRVGLYNNGQRQHGCPAVPPEIK